MWRRQGIVSWHFWVVRSVKIVCRVRLFWRLPFNKQWDVPRLSQTIPTVVRVKWLLLPWLFLHISCLEPGGDRDRPRWEKYDFYSVVIEGRVLIKKIVLRFVFNRRYSVTSTTTVPAKTSTDVINIVPVWLYSRISRVTDNPSSTFVFRLTELLLHGWITHLMLLLHVSLRFKFPDIDVLSYF